MAWGARARNNSAKVRKVNYHENEGSGKGPQRDDEAWSKGAKVAVVGVLLFTLAHTGLGPLVETAQNAMDVFDFGQDVKEYTDTVKSDSNVSNKIGVGKQDRTYEDFYKQVKNNIDLEASDVKDILEYLHGELSKSNMSNMDTMKASAIFIDYDCFISEKKYIKNVMNKLDNYEDTVTFIAKCPDYIATDAMQSEFDKISEIINANLSGYDTVFNKVSMNALTNLPESGDFVMSVTFYTE